MVPGSKPSVLDLFADTIFAEQARAHQVARDAGCSGPATRGYLPKHAGKSRVRR